MGGAIYFNTCSRQCCCRAATYLTCNFKFMSYADGCVAKIYVCKQNLCLNHQMKKLLLFALLIPVFSNAQNNYKPGFVVTLKGDTLQGAIDYKEWGQNPSKIQFINNQTPGNVEELSVENTKAFSVTGLEYYRRFVLPISQDQVELNKLTNKLDTSFKIKAVFLRVKSSGKYLTLYSYIDKIKSRFYVETYLYPVPEELIYHAFNDDAGESTSVKFIKRFRAQLIFISQQYHKNTTDIENQISQANYNERDLINIIQLINGNASKQYSSASLVGIRWFAGVGINFSSLKYFEPTDYNFLKGYSASSVFPKIDAGLDFFENKNTRRLIFRAEVTATINQYNSSIVDQGVPQSTGILNFKQYNTGIIPQVIYNLYNARDLKAFIGAGVAFNFSSYNNYEYVTKYGGALPDNVMKYPYLSNFWLSFPLKVGIAFNEKIEINACYIPSALLSNDNIRANVPNDFLESTHVTSFQLSVNYLFR